MLTTQTPPAFNTQLVRGHHALITRRLLVPLLLLFSGSASAVWCEGHYRSGVSNPVYWGVIGDQNNALNYNGVSNWGEQFAEGIIYSEAAIDSGPMVTTVYTFSVPDYWPGNNADPNFPYQMKLMVLGGFPSKSHSTGWTSYQLPNTSNTGCRNTNGNYLSESRILLDAGSVTLNVSGQGLSSGAYSVALPFRIGWGTLDYSTSPNSIFNRLFQRGFIPDVNNMTGYFKLDFSVTNKCELSDVSLAVLDHKTLTPNKAPGSLASDVRSITCTGDTPVSLTFNPSNVLLGNGLSSQLSIIDASGSHIIDGNINVKGNVSTPFRIQSILNAESSQIEPGKFSKSSILIMEYP